MTLREFVTVYQAIGCTPIAAVEERYSTSGSWSATTRATTTVNGLRGITSPMPGSVHSVNEQDHHLPLFVCFCFNGVGTSSYNSIKTIM